jgi:phospholipase C
MPSISEELGLIEHVFVLMIENRSFDHMLGFSQLRGKDPTGNVTKIEGLAGDVSNAFPGGGKFQVSAPADYQVDVGPGHEFKDVKEQLCGRGGEYSTACASPGELDPRINNSGYISNYSRYEKKSPERIMRCYSPDQLPVLTTLAKEFAVCDHWFSSIPGPTWPNRFFVHAASSGGLDDSPSFSREFKSIMTDGFRFENGTIYDCLLDANLDWVIYSADEFPQALSIAGMRNYTGEKLLLFHRFKKDLNSPTFSKSYVFIEPDYHAFTGHFRGGNSQHPTDDVTRGEKFIKDVYETIRNSPHWDTSLLIITYDEHGGFYDHIVPPATVHPGDSILDASNNHNNFNYTQLGVRVPTIIISPLIPKGTIDHTTYDHASVLATAERVFKLDSLTKRDATAQPVTQLIQLKTPRNDTPSTLPEPAPSSISYNPEKAPNIFVRLLGGVIEGSITPFRRSREPIDPSLEGFHYVALLRHLHTMPSDAKEEHLKRFLEHSNADAVEYMQNVKRKLSANHS